MKILFISPSPPNLMSRVRSHNILTAFEKLGHEVTLLSLYRNEKNKQNDFINQGLCKDAIFIKQSTIHSLINCTVGIILPIPLRVAYCYNIRLKKRVKQLIASGNYDLVYVKRLRMAPYAKTAHKLDVPTILDITDSLTKYYDRMRKVEHGIRKLLSIEEYYKHRFYEKKVCKTLYPIVICSESDRDYLVSNDRYLKNKIYVLHNSISIENWKNREFKIRNIQHRTRLVFFGVMDYSPNIIATEFFINTIFPLLPQCYTLKIIGANSEKLLHYSSERISFSGFVDNMKTALENNDIFVCPIIAGSGVKNKILQASMVGLPIVSTTLGVEGIDKRILDYAFIANSPDEFVASINQINQMDDLELYDRIRGQQRVIEEDNDSILVLNKLLKEMNFIE